MYTLYRRLATFFMISCIGHVSATPVETDCPLSPDPDRPDYHSADSDRCDIFYKCYKGLWMRHSCPPSLHFNIDTSTCDWAHLANCDSCPVRCSTTGGTCDFTNSRCDCLPGYTGAACSQDIDECANNAALCSSLSNQQCVNTPGSYTCECGRGYTRTTNGQCQDLCPVQCSTMYGTCDAVNLRCECLPGYGGVDCSQDIDECLQSPCSHTCTNTQGSYTCSCPQGLTLDTATGVCQVPATCATGQFQCVTSHQCIASVLRCDGSADCVDVSDEAGCGGEPAQAQSNCSSFPCLVFEDNFDSLDLTLWEHEISAGGGGNWEFQYYTNNRSNSYVRDGRLFIKPTLTSDKYGEDFLTQGELNLWGSSPADVCTGNTAWGCQRQGAPGAVLNPVQSARIRTSTGFNFKYGRLEVEAKMPTGDWLWPAIWLLPRHQAYGAWPASGEIDLVESRGNTNLRDVTGKSVGVDSVGSTLHFAPFAEANDWTKAHATYSAPSGNFGDSFHKYSMDWDDQGITFYVDGVQTLKVSPGDGGFWGLGEFEQSGGGRYDNPWQAGSKMAPFDQDFYIVINVAVGGVGYFPDTYTNFPSPKPWRDTSGHAATDFWNDRANWLPTWRQGTDRGEGAALQVNYVKVWKLQQDQ